MRNSSHVLSSAREAMAIPKEPTAWWAFASCVLGGLLLVRLKAPERLFSATVLAIAMTCFYLASDWISSLSGKGFHGDVPHGPRSSPLGWTLLLASLLCLAWFDRLLPVQESHFWAMALASAAVLAVLMFLLRLEMVPLDARLVLLSSALCTLPALFLGFVALGVGSVAAWIFWAPAALYFPTSALFAQAWLRGESGKRPALATMVLPLSALFVGAVAAGLWWQATLAALYIAWQIGRFFRRLAHGGDQLPPFSEIRRFGSEQAVWATLMVFAWMWTSIL